MASPDPLINHPKCDFHVHTRHLKCANETMVVRDIDRECRRLGVRQLGITDHLDAFDRVDFHVQIREDMETLETDIDLFFGVELDFTVSGEFAFSREIKEEYGFQFAIGGIHGTFSGGRVGVYLDSYDLQTLVDIQHCHQLKICHNSQIDILAHPYWFSKGGFDKHGWPRFDSMKAVPELYARELGQAAVETGTAVEINACANLVNSAYSSDRYVKEYIEFLSIVADEGASFSLASDSHDIQRLKSIQMAWQVAGQLKLPEDRIWQPKCRPMNFKTELPILEHALF